MSAPTPGQWKLSALDYRVIQGPDGLVIADVRTHPALSDSLLIVTAVNNHDDLLALAHRVAQHFEDTDAPLAIEARRVIDLAEGRE